MVRHFGRRAQACSGMKLVPEAGLEPARFLRRGILNPLCLPISPLRQKGVGRWMLARGERAIIAIAALTAMIFLNLEAICL